MKKSVFVAAFLAFSVGVFGQKIWFLSLEAAPAIKKQDAFFVNQNGNVEKGQPRNRPTLGLGCRVFRQSRQLIQPEFGFEIRGASSVPITNKTNFPIEQENDERIFEFAATSEIGFRLESRSNTQKWRVGFGPSLAIYLPFYSKVRGVFLRQDIFWEEFYGGPQLGFGLAVNFGRVLDSGRRVDFGVQTQNFRSAYHYYEHENSAFRLLKIRASVSFDKVEKGT